MLKLKYILLAALIFLVATISTSLSAQTKSYYATVEKAGNDTVLYIRGYNQKPQETGNVIFVDDNELTSSSFNQNGDELLKDDKKLKGRIKYVRLDVDNNFKPKNTKYWFINLSNVERIEGLEKLNTSEVSSMEGMFMDCRKLTGVDISSFDCSAAIMGWFYMFYNTGLTAIDLSNFYSEKAYVMSYMFSRCNALEAIDISNLNIAKISQMSNAFGFLDSLQYIFCSKDITLNQYLKETDKIFENSKALRGVAENGTEVKWASTNIQKDALKFADQGGYITKIKNTGEKEIGILPKTVYNYGEELDLRGGFITKTVSFGNSQNYKYKLCPLEAIAHTAQGFNSKNKGKQNISVTYGGKSYSFEIEVIDGVKDVIVEAEPSNNVYKLPFAKENIDLSGGKIKKVYYTGSTQEYDMSTTSYEIKSGFRDGMERGAATLELSFDLGDTNFVWNYNINLVDAEVELVVLEQPRKTKYDIGEKIEVAEFCSGVVLGAKLESGAVDNIPVSEIITTKLQDLQSELPEGVILTVDMNVFLRNIETATGVSIIPFSTETAGVQKLKFGYKGLECSCDIEVKAKEGEGGDEPGSGEEPGDGGGVAVEDLNACVSAFEAWTAGGVLSVKVERGGVLEVLGVNGALVRRFEVAAGSSVNLALKPGVYVLRLGGELRKVVVE